MKYIAKTIDAIKQRSHCLVVTCYEGAKLSDTADAVNAAGQQQLEALIKREEFQGKAGQTLLLLNPAGIAADRLLVLGLGATDKQGAISAENFRKAVARIPDALKSTPSREITACLGEVKVKDQDITWQARQLAEALELSTYRFDKFKSQAAENGFAPTKLVFGCDKKQSAAATRGRGRPVIGTFRRFRPQ